MTTNNKTNETRDAIHLITYIYPWLTDDQAAYMLNDHGTSLAVEDVMMAIDDLRQIIRDSRALDG